MIKLKLKRALSYTSDSIAASVKEPIIAVETNGEAEDAESTGYFDVIERGQDDSGESDETEKPDEGPEDNEPQAYTESSLKKLSAAEQREVIEELGGNAEDTNNEDERIALILQLQEEGE